MQQELQSRYAFNTVLAFVVAALLLILYSLKAHQLGPLPKSGLVWLVILFAALAHLARTFISESERLTYDLLRLHTPGWIVYLGKWLYNFSFTLVVNLLTFIAYLFLMQMQVVEWVSFATVILLGTASLTGIATIMAALVAQADRKGAIFSVIMIPLLMPLILILVRITKISIVTGELSTALNDIAALTGYLGATTTIGLLLFEYVWES